MKLELKKNRQFRLNMHNDVETIFCNLQCQLVTMKLNSVNKILQTVTVPATKMKRNENKFFLEIKRKDVKKKLQPLVIMQAYIYIEAMCRFAT